MSSRTKNSSIIRDGKRRRLSTVIIPIPPPEDSDVYIRTTTFERLDKLAHKFYGDSEMWWLIAAVNGLGKGTLFVPQDTRLRIPTNIRVIQDLIEAYNGTR